MALVVVHHGSDYSDEANSETEEYCIRQNFRVGNFRGFHGFPFNREYFPMNFCYLFLLFRTRPHDGVI